MTITRRDFIKASAAASALAGLGLPSDVLAAQGERWVKSVCRYCGTGCGLYVGVGRRAAPGGREDARGEDRGRGEAHLAARGRDVPREARARRAAGARLRAHARPRAHVQPRDERVDPISRQPEFKICAIKVEKKGNT